ncbi:hypothetical protein KIW84_023402 [Lathyrus oleraceus]|uniref:Uncharacterized protein n=1 Tax=Pisum sativum TaxID=3888 RepID=A0A9D4YCV9_PEA|nr:hypothetical protein KIW84_023402 [Pisum sativum]
MPAPKTEKQVRGFLGRLNYISRFISYMTIICAPIFKLLWKDQSCDWIVDFHKAFDIIKEYLLEPLILSPPVEGRSLIMYLTVLDESMGCVLGQQDEFGKKEYAIYYLSFVRAHRLLQRWFAWFSHFICGIPPGGSFRLPVLTHLSLMALAWEIPGFLTPLIAVTLDLHPCVIGPKRVHRYPTKENRLQLAMDQVQKELADMRERMDQFMTLMTGMAKGQEKLRELVRQPRPDPEVEIPNAEGNPGNPGNADNPVNTGNAGNANADGNPGNVGNTGNVGNV